MIVGGLDSREENKWFSHPSLYLGHTVLSIYFKRKKDEKKLIEYSEFESHGEIVIINIDGIAKSIQ